MRVMFWSESFPPYLGGIEVLAARFVTSLRRRGHEIVVVTRKDSDRLPDRSDYAGVPVYRFPLWTSLANRDVESIAQTRRRIVELKRTFRPEIVQLNAVCVGSMFQHATAHAYPAPLLVTLHGAVEDESAAPGTVFETALRAADWTTACSAWTLSVARRQVPPIAQRSSPVPNCLELPCLDPLPLDLVQPHLLCVGRLNDDKGFAIALDAMALLVRRRPSLRLTIAGNGPLRQALEGQAAELGLTNSVDFLGWVDPAEVPQLISASTAVLMPSRYESFGLVALQAAQLARPLIGTRVGGLQEVVVDGETGALVEPEDSVGLAAAVERLLDNPDGARRMGAAARERALRCFDWNAYLDAYEDLYSRLVSRRLSRSAS